MIFFSKNVKVNAVISKYLLAVDKFMPDWIYVQSLWIIYKKQRKNTKIQRNKNSKKQKTRDCEGLFSIRYGLWLMHVYKNQPGRTAPEKVLPDKAFSISNNPQYDGYRRGLTSMA